MRYCGHFLIKAEGGANNWRASEATETLSGVYKFELVRYVYIYMYGGTYVILVAHATYT